MRRPPPLVLCLLLLGLGACDTITSLTPDETGEEGGTPSGEIDPAWTAGALEDVQQRMAQVMPDSGTAPENRNLMAELQTLKDSLEGLPEVAEVGVLEEQRTATIVLTNGVPIAVFNNRPYRGSESGAAPLHSEISNSQSALRRISLRPPRAQYMVTASIRKAAGPSVFSERTAPVF